MIICSRSLRIVSALSLWFVLMKCAVSSAHQPVTIPELVIKILGIPSLESFKIRLFNIDSFRQLDSLFDEPEFSDTAEKKQLPNRGKPSYVFYSVGPVVYKQDFHKRIMDLPEISPLLTEKMIINFCY